MSVSIADEGQTEEKPTTGYFCVPLFQMWCLPVILVGRSSEENVQDEGLHSGKECAYCCCFIQQHDLEF